MVVTRDRGDGDDAAPPPPGIRHEVAKDALCNRRGAVLRPDRYVAAVPPVAHLPERWDKNTLQQDDDLGAFGGQLAGDVPRPRLVAVDERLVHPPLLRLEATDAGRTSGRGRAQLGLDRGEVVPGHAVAATHERRR